MFIDTHCHLTFPEFDIDRNELIGNAKKANVKYFIVPGIDMLSSRQSIELAMKHPSCIRSSIGFHPYEAQDNPDSTKLQPLINEFVVAIGECGLDYHMYKGEEAISKKTNQIRIFRDQIEIAIAHSLPLIMHCRDAFDDFFDTLDNYAGQITGVIHCFSGGLQDIRAALSRNLYMGIDGNLTYSKYLQEIVPSIPLPSLLLETDSPYLTPLPNRGKRNEPKYLTYTAKKAATLFNVSVNEIALQTTANAKNLFHLPI